MSARVGAPGHAPAASGVLSAGRIALCLGFAALLLWPMALVSTPIVYFDSYAYDSAGRAALAILRDLLPAAEAPAGGGGGAPAGEGGGGEGIGALRSAAWSVALALLGGLPWGAALLCALQTAATLLVCGALVPPGTAPGPVRWVPAAASVALLTGLPWYASYAMPDILGALVIAYYAAVASGAVRGAPAAVALGALATFAILGHYGHVPLAAGLAVVVAAMRWRRLGAAGWAMLAGPLVLAIAVNLATSAALARVAPAPPAPTAASAPAAPALPSATPRRLPILLARTIEDGPGLRHLREACARGLYATCDLFDPLPATATAFLWGPDGIRTLSPAEMAILRAEEGRIVLGAARAYPAAQAGAFARNVAEQLALVGVDQHFAAPPPAPGEAGRPNGALALADRAVPLVTALAAAVLLWRLASGRLAPALRPALWVLAAGLLINALVYGGLSYPVDRYGGRIAWLIPALLALDLALGGRARRPAP